MKIDPHQISIRDIVDGYVDSGDDGVVGYGGKLNIRPPYQREFVYKDKQRDLVINTIRNGFPLNIMYWAVNADGTFEVLDGQQRTISFCQYVKKNFSIEHQFFFNLTPEEQKAIFDYELTVYWCSGDTREKLDWFKIVNIAGEKLLPQELRNAVYTGKWLADAKLKFSRPNCAASRMSKNYVTGSPIRQVLFEKALKWKSGGNIEQYMADHQEDQNANELWLYFQNLIHWIEATFPVVHANEMQGVDWGPLYDEFGSKPANTDDLEAKLVKLFQDDEVSDKSGAYAYVLTGKEQSLSLRQFEDNMRLEAYTRQKGICPMCKKRSDKKQHYDIKEMQADHVKPWSKGGRTIASNCQMLCGPDNLIKSNIYTAPPPVTPSPQPTP